MSRRKRYVLTAVAALLMLAFAFVWVASRGEGGSYTLIFDSEGRVIDAKPW
jgi:hypothetical protein